MPELLIERLRKLQRQRGDVSPFSSHTEFLAWSDNVSPLLSFNSVLQNEFDGAVRASNINFSEEGILSNINRAIGIVNQAVTQLEIAPLIEQVKIIPLEVPEKLTLRWVQDHVPWPVYAALGGAFLFCFTVGWNASSILTNNQTSPLSDTAPTTTKPTIASPAITYPTTPKSIASAPK